MTHNHPIHYLVTVSRNNHVMHRQQASTRDEADQLASRFEAAPGAIVDITEIHEQAETDLTTHTRELVEDLQVEGASE